MDHQIVVQIFEEGGVVTTGDEQMDVSQPCLGKYARQMRKNGRPPTSQLDIRPESRTSLFYIPKTRLRLYQSPNMLGVQTSSSMERKYTG